jgi:hypothetical protein
VREREFTDLARRDLGVEEVALVDRALERPCAVPWLVIVDRWGYGPSRITVMLTTSRRRSRPRPYRAALVYSIAVRSRRLLSSPAPGPVRFGHRRGGNHKFVVFHTRRRRDG